MLVTLAFLQVSLVADIQTLQARSAICGITGGPTTNAFRPYYGIRLFPCSVCNLGGDASTCAGSDVTRTPSELERTICPTAFSGFRPSSDAKLKNLTHTTDICVADPICGYGQPYNVTSKRCVIPTRATSTDSSVTTCPRYSAFDTYTGTCIYVGDLQTPTTISVATLAHCPAGKSPVVVTKPGAQQRFVCQAPATILPPAAVLESVNGVQKVVAVVGVAAYPIPVPLGSDPTTVSIAGPGPFTMTKTQSVGNPDVHPPYVYPVTGQPDNTITFIGGIGPGVVTTPTALNCTGINNLTSLYALSQTDPARAAECIKLAQFGCPSLSQLQMYAYYNGTSAAKKPSNPAAAGVSVHEAFDAWASKFKQWVRDHV